MTSTRSSRADRYILGQETCAACGETTFVISRESHVHARSVECSRCGAKACGVKAWFPASCWPEVETLVAFDEAAEQLGLETCIGLRMH